MTENPFSQRPSRTESSHGPQARVTLTAQWRKSTYSDQDHALCVEVARTAANVAVRDSKHPERPHLALTRPVWRMVLAALR